MSEYNLKRNVGATAIKLDAGDKINSIIFTDNAPIGILSRKGNFILIDTKDIRPIGRVSRGIVGMKLDADDSVASARALNEGTVEILSVTESGYAKRTAFSEFKKTGRGTKGSKIQKSEDNLCDFIFVATQKEVLIVSSSAQIRIHIDDIPLLGRGAQGVKAIKLSQNSKIRKISSL